MHIGFYFVASYIDTVNVQIVDIGFCFVARQATTTIFVTVRLQARRQNSVSTSSALPFVNNVDIVIFVNFVDIVNFVNIVMHNTVVNSIILQRRIWIYIKVRTSAKNDMTCL